jgi:hypothetical protein
MNFQRLRRRSNIGISFSCRKTGHNRKKMTESRPRPVPILSITGYSFIVPPVGDSGEWATPQEPPAEHFSLLVGTFPDYYWTRMIG